MAAGSTERTSGYFGDQTPSETRDNLRRASSSEFQSALMN
jgi:hypothetical protein